MLVLPNCQFSDLQARCLGHVDNPVTSGLDYRHAIIRFLRSGTTDESFALAYDAYAKAGIGHADTIASFGMQGEALLPDNLSRAIQDALHADSTLLPLVNCANLPCGTPQTNDDCYRTIEWAGLRDGDDERWLLERHVFGRESFRIPIEKSVLGASLLDDECAYASHALTHAHMGRHFDRRIICRCMETAQRNGTDKAGPDTGIDSKAQCVRVSPDSYRDWHFWKSMAHQATTTVTGKQIWVVDSLTAAELEALRDDRGKPIVRYDDNMMRMKMFGLQLIPLVDAGMSSHRPAVRDEAFAILLDPSGLTANFMPGLPLFMATSMWRHTSPYQDILLPCDCKVTDSRGWMFLCKG